MNIHIAHVLSFRASYNILIISLSFPYSMSYQLMGRKSNSIFLAVKYLIERTMASIQPVEYVE